MPTVAGQSIRTLLVAADLSNATARVVERATLLPLAAASTMELVHVLPAGLPARAQLAAERSARDQLARLGVAATALAGARGRRLEVLPAVLVGQPYVEIIRRSRASGAELVLLGRQPGRERARRRAAATARRVIRKGDLPVLVVAVEPTDPYRRPLVAVDLSDTSSRVVELGRRLVTPRVATLSLVHAYHVPFETWLKDGDVATERRGEAASRLRSLRTELCAGVGARAVVRKGDPTAVILGEAMRRDADLVVVGTHGRSGLSRTLHGCVAEEIVVGARCDVAVTRPIRYSFSPR